MQNDKPSADKNDYLGREKSYYDKRENKRLRWNSDAGLERSIKEAFGTDGPYICADMHRPGTPIDNIVDSIVNKLDAKVAPMREAFELWQEVCPPIHLEQCTVSNVANGVIYIKVSYQPLIFMLESYQKRNIMNQINQICPGKYRDIRFVSN